MNVANANSVQELGRAQRRASRTRKRLLDAALAMFTEKGVDPTTIEDITERADVGKGTFYRHFRNKDQLVVALVEDAVAQLVDRIRAPGQPLQNLEQVLQHLLDAHLAFFVDSTDRFLLMFQGRVLLKLDRQTGAGLGEPYVRYLEQIEKQIAPFVAQPVDGAKIRRLACAVAGFVSGFFSFAMIGMPRTDIDKSLEPLRYAFVAASSTFLGR